MARFSCTVPGCSERFYTRQDRNDHEYSEHSDESDEEEEVMYTAVARFNCTVPGCSARFYTRQDRDNHEEHEHGEEFYDDEEESDAVARFNCTVPGCSARFYTRQDRDNHEEHEHGEDGGDDHKAKAGGGGRVDLGRLPVPGGAESGAEGEWVSAAMFRRESGLGYFRCGCGHWWMSPGTVRLDDGRWTAQGCRRCGHEHVPLALWKSAKSRGDRRPEDRGPHDRDLCEACRMGRCPLRA